jgi:6-phosphogluconolactonase
MEVGRVGAGIDPHSVRLHPRGHTLYATSHGFAKELPNVAYNALWWYPINAVTGVPTLVNEISTGGTDPAEFAIDPTGTFLVMANYLSDTLSVFRLTRTLGH